MRTWDFSRLETLKREKEAKEDRDIEWQEVADSAAVSISTLIRYRRNEVKQPQFHVVMALCDYFGVSPDYFEEEETPGNQKGHQPVGDVPIVSSILLQA